MVENTILVHRKKQTNTLYTINALNELIKSLNNGVLDKSFSVNWNDYRNCILLIQTEGFNRIDTKIKEIINLQQKNLVQPKMLHILNEVIKEYSHLTIKKSYEFR